MLAPELTNEIVDAKFRQIDIQIERAKRRINKVYSTNINFSIYLDDSLRIRTHYNISQTAANVDLAKCQYKAKQLESYAHEYLEGEQLELALDQIAICLSHSFKLNQMNERVEPSEVFQSVEDLLDSKFSAKLRLKFIGWVIGFTVLFAILLTLILFNTQNIELYVKSMLIALLGSFISIVQRHNLIKTTVNMSPITVAIESFSRICIGIIFGFICILLSKSGLALANFADNQHALLVFSFLSGFSERFIPNMLDTVANNQQATRK
ncbi:hypothetical protein RRM58_005537 [Vibrio harveyi]|nr:hypothetical protein [Vibrio harveyi]